MNQITTQYITENGACYEQYVITDPAAKTSLTITPERGGMITGFTLDGDEYIWTRRPNFSECNRPRKVPTTTGWNIFAYMNFVTSYNTIR